MKIDDINIAGGMESQKPEAEGDQLHRVMHLKGMYKDWFLDYASYVILERAVPHLHDGLKPVQRRILHSMRRMDDGRYNKVANIIGHTMQFHPHGDASIGDALVQLGQKDLLIDTQGNWGNILTGDNAAAPRYIEARLSKFALEVIFNPKTTEWKQSYDGRNKEPLTLPVKFPLLLAQGVEGIAVGLASKILPHNFNELIEASIEYLRGKPFTLFPDFPSGGMADASRYNDGLRGGTVRVRARINKVDSKTLSISELPFGQTTGSLIDSIIKANEKGKIRIKKIDDNTSDTVEILIQLAPGTEIDKTIDALYAFTDCEIPISVNCCVVDDNHPRFLGVSEMLKISTDRTVALLKQELEIRQHELMEELLFSSLEKIFIEKRIYHDIEECETWESVLETIAKGLKPYKKQFYREITQEDIIKLTEIRIKRISKFDAKKANELMKGLKAELEEVKSNLSGIVQYTINYFRQIKKKYGNHWERKTELRSFESIEAARVVIANEKLFVNREEGFVGTGLKKDEYVSDCSDIDDVIIIRRDGTYLITKISEKSFVGKDIIHVAVFNRNDSRTIYNVVYRDGRNGYNMIKRCAITGLTRDKEYAITKGTADSRILYMSVNPNGEAETIKVFLNPRPRLRNLVFEFDFSTLEIRGKSSMGNVLSRFAIHKIVMKERGASTLGGTRIWYDPSVNRLNTEERGNFLGEFMSADRILVITRSGNYRLSNFDLSNHFEDDAILVEKYVPGKLFSAVYYDAEQRLYYIKRFHSEANDKLQKFIDEHEESRVVLISEHPRPRIEVKFGGRDKQRLNEVIDVEAFIGVKGFKAKGKRITTYKIDQITEIEPLTPPPALQKLAESAETDSSTDEGDTQMTLGFGDKSTK
jgi:topoisomerase IV subunit A